jgi:hypothetical protein
MGIDIDNNCWDIKFDIFKEHVSKWKRLPSLGASHIGNWTYFQKKNYINNKLDDYKLTKLCSVSQWKDWMLKEKKPKKIISWNDSLALLKQYINFNHALPYGKTSHGHWLCHQKAAFKNKTLSKERLEQLDQIDLWLKWKKTITNKRHKHSWDEAYMLLKTYVDKHQKFPPDHTKIIADWILRQKRAYRNKTLDEYKLHKLNELTIWKSWAQLPKPEQISWDERFNELDTYVKSFSKFPSKDTNNSLFIWMHTQRKNYFSNKLLPERIDKLSTINIWSQWIKKYRKPTKIIPDAWNTHYNELKLFINSFGKLPTDRKIFICTWLKTQKSDYIKNKLSSDRIQKLELLDLWNQWTVQINKPIIKEI